MLQFTKMSGAGNDFIILDNRSGDLKEEISGMVQAICRRGLSVGADGVILVGRSRVASVRMIYFNADGSRAGFCANGTRCLARYAWLNGLAKKRNVKIETDIGIVSAEVFDDGSVALPVPGSFQVYPYRSMHLDALPLEGAYAVVGVPHYILPVENLWGSGIESLGRRIRNHDAFAPDGVNVDFVSVQSRTQVAIRSYERGVEKETLSCGSGCVATALCLAARGEVDAPLIFKTLSGIDLVVRFVEADGSFEQVKLQGDARLIFRGVTEADLVVGK